MEKVNISKNEAEKFVALFFEIIDAVYGGGLHHVGDGDGIDPMTAEDIRSLYKKYADFYFKNHKITIK